MFPLAWQKRFTVCLLAGGLPIVVVLLAYGLNLRGGLEGCNVVWDGCLSVSRAVDAGHAAGDLACAKLVDAPNGGFHERHPQRYFCRRR